MRRTRSDGTGFLLSAHRNGGMIADREKRRFPCPCCGKIRPKSWQVRLLVVAKDPALSQNNKRMAICRRCWQNIGQHYNALGTGRYFVSVEEG